MKSLSKICVACLVSLLILTSCSKEEGMFTLNPNVTPVESAKTTQNTQAEQTSSARIPLLDHYNYTGHVVSEEDGQPIVNAILTTTSRNGDGIKNDVARTDFGGQYVLTLNTIPEAYEVSVEARGYVTKVVNLADLEEGKILLEIRTRPTSRARVKSSNSVDQ